MARGAEARAAMVAAADLRLAEAGGFPRPTKTSRCRSDLLANLFIQNHRHAEEGAVGAVAYCAADASPPRSRRTQRVDRGISSIWPPSASGPPRLRIAPCRGIRKETFFTGANDTHIATLVERNTRFTMLVKIPRKDTTTVVAALAKHIGKLPEELRRSLTWDQGKEMHAHKRFTVPPTSRSTSVIRAVPGSAAQTRTPTACCVSTSREEPTSRASLRAFC